MSASARSRTRAGARALLAIASLAATIGASRAATAAGLYFSDRGVRPMGRAGAFVAGADDLHGIWYNPAGLADAGDAVLADFTWVRLSNTYTRRLRIVDADDTVRVVESPTIEGSSPLLPLPTLTASKVLDEAKRWTIALGMPVPYIALASYPKTTADGQPSPARYSLGSFEPTPIGLPGAWLAWKPKEELRIGLGAMALAGWLQTTITFSVSPQDRLIGAPEQPEWDANSQLRIGPMFAPTGMGGVIWQPDPHVRFGVSGQLPMVVSAPATIKVSLPTSVALDSARVRGESAHVRLTLPAVVRAGVELRPIATPREANAGSDLRIELAWIHEFWSQHRTIEATPKDIYLEGITGAPPSVAMPKIVIPRNFVDTDSFRIGGEWTFLAAGYRMALRTGLSYETSAVPNAYMSLTSLDFPKTTLAFGGSLYIGKQWRFDALLAHMFTKDVVVTPEQARIPRINPLRGNAPLEAVNGGTYTANANLIGVGLNYLY